ncbi:MAG: hypothetical protein V3U16_07030 [Candidatus Neomarinimicrobiota bacterium]
MKIIHRYISVIAALIVFLGQGILIAQVKTETGSPRSDPFALFADYFLGTWDSDQEACVGMGAGTRVYRMILKDRYIHVDNEAYFPSDDPDKAGDLHKDWGIISYSGGIHIREFNSEGFIIHYVQDSAASSADSLVFYSSEIENGPPGLQARLTIARPRNREGQTFTEHFEMAFSGKEFKTYVFSSWIRSAQ